MTATAEVDPELDRRVHPGDGKRAPRTHVVRIVVVDDERLTTARHAHAANRSHGLTEEELRVAEGLLKTMPAPTSPAERTAEGRYMFDVLKSTDIVAVDGEPASVCESEQGRELRKHDDRNRNTVLRVWTESDTIEYQCDRPFEIVGVKRAGWMIYDAPEDPFGNSEDSYKAQKRDRNGKELWVWTSGLLPARANNQQYKMTFRIDGQLVDPDVVCGDPPPVPGP